MQTRSHFDNAAKTWDTEETIKRNNIFAQAIKKHLNQHIGNVLDFGCGTGLLTSHFLKLADDLIGIETSTGMLEQFSERFAATNKVKCLCLNLENDPLPTDVAPFDLIMSAMAFHHLRDPLKMLSLFKRHLTSQGMVCIIDLDEEDGSFHPDNQGMGVHHFGFSKITLESWSQKLGFSSFHHEIIFQMNKNERRYDVALSLFTN